MVGNQPRGLPTTRRNLSKDWNDHTDDDKARNRLMIKDLKVATWNVRGITHKEEELEV
ncbi:hypothetical protein L9F63_016332, partial [Diploptera punctata]